MSRISIRNVVCDFYTEKPNGFNRSIARSANRLPIIRIFGILDSGQKCCAHIHGVFPYILLRIGTALTPRIEQELRSVIVMAVLQSNPRISREIVESGIHNIESVVTKSLYGFHKEEDYFAKILFYSPKYLKMVSDALQQEAFSNSSFQVFEAHVPYLLQFFMDYSIFGMDLVHFKAFMFRISPRRNVADRYIDDLGLTVGRIVSSSSLLSPVLPSTTVAVEFDAFATDIINPEEHAAGGSSNPGLRFIWSDEERRCKRRGKILEAESSQEERPSPLTENEKDWLQRLRGIVRNLDKRFASGLSPQQSSSVFNDTIVELSRTLTMNQGEDTFSNGKTKETGESLAAFDEAENFWSQDALLLAEGTGVAIQPVECNEEREEVEDMSQPLSAVCATTPSTKPSDRNAQFGDTSGITANQTKGSVVIPSTTSDDASASDCKEESNAEDKSGRRDDALTEAVPGKIDDRAEAERCSSNGSADLFDEESSIDFKNHWENEEDTGRALRLHQRSISSFSSACSLNNKPREVNGECTNSAQLPKEELRLCDVPSTSHSADEKSCSQSSADQSDENFMLNPSESFENDIENLWIPARPWKRRSDDISDQRSLFASVIKKKWKPPTDVAAQPLSSTYSFPLRCKSDQKVHSEISLSKVSLPVENKVEKLELSQVSEDIGESMTESWCEPTLSSYEKVKEKLEATLVALPEPAASEGEERGDIRHLCVLSLEILALVRPGQPVPDPKEDEVMGAFCSVSTDVCFHNGEVDEEIALLKFDANLVTPSDRIHLFSTEDELLEALVKFIQKHDPDIVLGYNTRRSSWGYLIERSIAKGTNLLSDFSRCKLVLSDYYRPDIPTFTLDPTPRGRLLINVWRTLRHEIALRSYTQSNVVHVVLNRRFPQYSYSTLTEWMSSNDKRLISIVIQHMTLSSRLNIRILCQLELFTSTAEMARVYGIQFSEVLSRGSQFRVESMLLRLARSNKLAAATVSPAQRSAMCAPETLALNMEPESGFYRDPVIVLDFQSLYPSIMIAYNYCFSTCFGKVANMNEVLETGAFDSMELGGLRYSLPVKEISSMLSRNELHISPVGGVFCKKSARRGIIPVMLEEVLNTRIMVKKAAKEYKSNRWLSSVLNARQLALKLIANVTYGYTAANWSGRMPCVEVADAIVSKGREALERAIAMVNEGKYGAARVIYGDTDSLFVLCPGSSREQAFDIGERIAKDVTASNPDPVKLKLEKIMHPVILEAKKRYVGMSYEKRDDTEGIFDAKGIETVRRDSCPLASRILEKSLRLLFANNLPAVVRYLDMQFSHLDQLPLTDFIFSREYRGFYADTAFVPAKRIAEKRRAICARDEPEPGERVPYVIVDGDLNSTLISCVREPWEFVHNKRLTLNYDYYIQRHVLPALHRAFDYVPMHFEWRRPIRGDCFKCGALGARPWCIKCASDPHGLFLAVCKLYREQRLNSQMVRLCRSCIALRNCDLDYSKCINLSCLVTQKRIGLNKSIASDAVKRHRLYSHSINTFL